MVISESSPHWRHGGSFNPVHYGHLHVARDVKHRLRLDHMFLMPAAQSPLKAQHSVPASHRVAMLNRALGHSELELDYREIDKGAILRSIVSRSCVKSLKQGVPLFHRRRRLFANTASLAAVARSHHMQTSL